jgi:hypothetical protein
MPGLALTKPIHKTNTYYYGGICWACAGNMYGRIVTAATFERAQGLNDLAGFTAQFD